MSVTTVWSYVPQQVLQEAESPAGLLVNLVSPRADVTGTVASGSVLRSWRLQYPVVCTTSEVRSMLAFYDARLGGWESFKWVNPNDGATYDVVFEGDLRASLGVPGRYSIPEVRLRAVTNPEVSSVAFGASSVGIAGFRPSTTGSAGFVVHGV